MQAHLIAVQAAMTLRDYRDEASFAEKILTLTREAVAGLDDAPKLVAFPETIGFPLLLTLGDYERVSSLRSASAAMKALLRQHWRGVLAQAWRYRSPNLRALYALRAPAAYRAYCAAFSKAARCYGVTIVGGSIFLPTLEHEPSRGLYLEHPAVNNVAYSFSPYGRLLDKTCKCHLVPKVEARAGLTCAASESIHNFLTPLGRVGVAICLDGFYESVLERLDGLGTDIVVQPSANHAAWDRLWPPDPTLQEGEAWLRYGLRAGLQDRLALRYGINPMLVGDVWDLSPRGRSSLLANTRYLPGVETEGYEGVLAFAPRADEEAIVRACVTLPSEMQRPTQ